MNYEESLIVFSQILGCEAYVKRLMSDKLTPKLDKYFLSVSEGNQMIFFYNKAKGKVFVTRNGFFLEKEFLSKGFSGSKVQLEEIQETPENVSAPTNPILEVQEVVPPDIEAPAPRRSIKACHANEKFTLLTTKQRDVLLLDNNEPMTYTEAMMGLNSEK
jgi:hypothetical protein